VDDISGVKVLNSPANLSEKEAAVRLREGEVFSGHSLKQLPAIQVLHDWKKQFLPQDADPFSPPPL